MANPRKRKGTRKENELVKKLIAKGIPARRVPLSGAGSIPGDVQYGPRFMCTAELKARKDGEGFKTLERWMGDCDSLVLWKDRAEPMVMMTWAEFVRLWGYVMELEEG